MDSIEALCFVCTGFWIVKVTDIVFITLKDWMNEKYKEMYREKIIGYVTIDELSLINSKDVFYVYPEAGSLSIPVYAHGVDLKKFNAKFEEKEKEND